MTGPGTPTQAARFHPPPSPIFILGGAQSRMGTVMKIVASSQNVLRVSSLDARRSTLDAVFILGGAQSLMGTSMYLFATPGVGRSSQKVGNPHPLSTDLCAPHQLPLP